MKLFKRIRKSKRGFAMAETIIALAVISIVSMATMTLILSSNTATRSANYKLDAQNYTEDIIECFRITDNKDDFNSSVAFALGFADGTDFTDNIPEHLEDSEYSLSISYSEQSVSIEIKNGSKKITAATFNKGGVSE